MSRLSSEKSHYLRHAARQKIDWHPWSDEAFREAGRLDRPVFLSSGAVWCHWCHVMAKECFENDEIVSLLNERFISIKLDRDERPDIDRRYQRAVAAMGNGNGWPLSVFLTPEGAPFFGGTYFPPEDGFGRPGFRKVLISVSDFYRSNRADAAGYSARLMEYILPDHASSAGTDISILDRAVEAIMAEFDTENGGFGTAPKFPAAGALSFLMGRFFFSGGDEIGQAVRKTLIAMAEGGYHDHLGGGFHRYSTDSSWTIPHFEKMADDNAWLMRTYACAYALFGEDSLRAAAEGIAGFFLDVLSAPEGGFYCSQDADVTPDDEGGYFTWTGEELRAGLDEETYKVFSMRMLDEKGVMHHDASKHVLSAALPVGEISAETGIDPARIEGLISQARTKLLQRRNARKAPFIDTAIYTSVNGMVITSFLMAADMLHEPRLREFGLRSIDAVLRRNYKGNELFHAEGVAALLDDYIFFVEALVSAYETTGDQRYMDLADQLMETCCRKFRDEAGGFFDTADKVLGVRLKTVEDSPHPSANAVAAQLLLRLSEITGKTDYRRWAEESLGLFSGDALAMGLHASSYFCGLEAYHRMVTLNVEADPACQLAETALSAYHPCKAVRYGDDRGRIIPCSRGRCSAPIVEPQRMKEFLSNNARPGSD